MDKLLQIQIAKIYSECQIAINTNSSVANTDIGFKDICITLRSSKELFDSISLDNGNCEINVFNSSSVQADIELLSKEELIARVKFYSDNLTKQKDYLQRISIYRNIAKVQSELIFLYNSISSARSKEQILSSYGAQIEFYNNQLFFNLFPSRIVEITQNGFTFSEIQSLMNGAYGQYYGKYPFNYNVNFETLVVS